MKYSLLLSLQETSGLSPEQLGQRMGISGMTLRRWKEDVPKGEIPAIYERAIVDCVYQLIQEGCLSPESEVAKQVIQNTENLVPFQAAIRNLGLSSDFLEKSGKHKNAEESGALIGGLSQIGASEERKATVDQSRKKILSFKKISTEWAGRITSLLKIIGSKDFKVFEKWAAYGALFYLITPFDLIPDHIPAFGLIDDFAIMGFAVNYYLKYHSNKMK